MANGFFPENNASRYTKSRYGQTLMDFYTSYAIWLHGSAKGRWSISGDLGGGLEWFAVNESNPEMLPFPDEAMHVDLRHAGVGYRYQSGGAVCFNREMGSRVL